MRLIHFFSEDTHYNLKNKTLCRQWLAEVVKNEKQQLKNINYIFCSDTYLHKVNVEYLNHDTFTDVITFPYSEYPKAIESDIFISVDRCKANAESFGIKYTKEVHRVMVHGLLHLLGYNDKTKKQKIEMSAKEDYYLSLRPENLTFN